jgi:hypothetical protein
MEVGGEQVPKPDGVDHGKRVNSILKAVGSL